MPLAGLVTMALLGFDLYEWLSSSVYGVNAPTSLIFMGSLYVLTAVVYAYARWARQRQGIDLRAICGRSPTNSFVSWGGVAVLFPVALERGRPSGAEFAIERIRHSAARPTPMPPKRADVQQNEAIHSVLCAHVASLRLGILRTGSHRPGPVPTVSSSAQALSATPT